MGNRIHQRDDRRCWFDFSLFPGLMRNMHHHYQSLSCRVLWHIYSGGWSISLWIIYIPGGVERWWWRWWWWACRRSSCGCDITYGFVLQSGKCQFMACLSLRRIAGTLLTKKHVVVRLFLCLHLFASVNVCMCALCPFASPATCWVYRARLPDFEKGSQLNVLCMFISLSASVSCVWVRRWWHFRWQY